MLSYNILNDFVEKLKSGNVTPDDLVKVGNAVKDADLQVKYEVENIKAIPSDILNEVKCGDVIAKKTGLQYHCYIVTYKQENTGICLTYFDASVVETQSYDYVTDAWVYNSEDKTNIIYTAGTGINITNGQISADTNVLQPKLTAGENITITDDVISAGAGDIWESVISYTKDSVRWAIRLFTVEEVNASNVNTIFGSEIANKSLPTYLFGASDATVISRLYTNIARGSSTTTYTFTYLELTTMTVTNVATTKPTFTVEYSHKLN